MRQDFEEKRDSRKVAEAEKLAARRAALEKKTQARLVSEKVKEAAEAREVEENRAAEARATTNQDAGGKEGLKSPWADKEESEDNIPLWQINMKAMSNVEMIPLSDTEEGTLNPAQEGRSDPSSSPPVVSSFTKSSPPAAQGNLFMDGASSAGVRLVKSLTSATEMIYLQVLGHNHKLFKGVTWYFIVKLSMFLLYFHEIFF